MSKKNINNLEEFLKNRLVIKEEDTKGKNIELEDEVVINYWQDNL